LVSEVFTMKQFTHAWLAFMATKRLEDAAFPPALSPKFKPADRLYADGLINWFKSNKDGVIRGAWYPDSLIKDNGSSHVLKFEPCDETSEELRRLPNTYLIYEHGRESPLRHSNFRRADKNDNLPDRCEALTQSAVDHLKVQESEERGSAVSPTDNQVALWLFMLSHYVADAHVPFHCDSRQFSEGADIHGKMEREWDKEVQKFYKLDHKNERFFYDPRGYPLMEPGKERKYESSYLKKVEDALSRRVYMESVDGSFGTGNRNVREFMGAICQYSYLLSYYFVPKQYDHTNIKPKDDWKSLGGLSFEELSVAVLADAIDSIARVWLRAWRRYAKWIEDQEAGAP
jgi:hypothetical protein